MDAWLIWLIVAALLVAVEVMSQMMWALCLSAGALAAMVCALCGLDLTWQTVALAVVCIAAYILLLPIFKRRHHKAGSPSSRTGMDALLGRRAFVTHSVHPDRLGRARIDGDNWQIKAPGVSETIPAGTEVTVVDYDSIILIVEKC